MRIHIYWNFHKKCFSLSKTHGKKRWPVEHIYKAYIENASFIVRQSGREKVLKEKVKNVHAFIKVNPDEGKIDLDQDMNIYDKKGTYIKYNPYLYDSFVTMSEEPISKASKVLLSVKDGRPIIKVLV